MKKFALTVMTVVAALVCPFAFSACGEEESYALSVSPQVEHGEVILTQNEANACKKVRLACMPDRGYRLTGYTVDGEVIDGNTFIMPDKAVEVSANFEAVEYAITYVLNGGTVASGNPSSYSAESGEIELIAPTKEGYEFGYWYYYFPESEDRYVEPEDYMTEKIEVGTIGKLTLYARYFNVPHSVETDEDNDDIYVYPDNYLAEAGEEVTLYHEMRNDYCKFLYYTVDGEKIDGDSFIMPNHSVTVSAKAELTEFKINYVLDGGTNSRDNPESYTFHSEMIILDGAVKEGYTFIYWYYLDEVDEEQPIYIISGSDVRDYTLYALFEPDDIYDDEEWS